jgi:hypothetical protein
MFLTIPLCGNTSCIGFSRPERRTSGILTGKLLRILSFDCVDIPQRNLQEKPFNHNRLSCGEKVCFEDALPLRFVCRASAGGDGEKLDQIVGKSGKKILR